MSNFELEVFELSQYAISSDPNYFRRSFMPKEFVNYSPDVNFQHTEIEAYPVITLNTQTKNGIKTRRFVITDKEIHNYVSTVEETLRAKTREYDKQKAELKEIKSLSLFQVIKNKLMGWKNYD